jgi:leader peptidase (prepilin peptidase)/N-methyltransferase
MRYAIVELVTALLFVAVASSYGWSAQAFLYAAFSACLIAITFIDLELRLIPDELSLGGWGVALLAALFQAPWYPIGFMDALLGSMAGYFIFWIVSRGFYLITQEEGLGGGDVKLMGFVGAVLGWKGALTTIIVGNFMGLFVGLVLIFFLKKTRKSPIPLGPFLAMGAFVHLFHLDQWWWM